MQSKLEQKHHQVAESERVISEYQQPLDNYDANRYHLAQRNRHQQQKLL